MKLEDFNLRDFGHSIQIVGAVFSRGADQFYIAALPGEGPIDIDEKPCAAIEMSDEDWAAVLYQTDILEVEMQGAIKAVVRKSQRQIDTAISWAVYKRDGYRCRYCGSDGALSVDHIDLWEMGGASVAENLLSCCKKCNRTRGSMPYDEWLDSKDYENRSRNLTDVQRADNRVLILRLPVLKELRQKVQRSR